MPGKRTILALAIALELTLDETDDLLERAGYALSHSQKFDVIVEFFIVSGKYDILRLTKSCSNMISHCLERADVCRFQSDQKKALLLYPVDTRKKAGGLSI